MLCNKRSHPNEKPGCTATMEQPLLTTATESPCEATKTRCSQKWYTYTSDPIAFLFTVFSTSFRIKPKVLFLQSHVSVDHLYLSRLLQSLGAFLAPPGNFPPAVASATWSAPFPESHLTFPTPCIQRSPSPWGLLRRVNLKLNPNALHSFFFLLYFSP